MFEIPSDIESRAPAHDTPIGPVWALTAAEIAVESSVDFLVRRLSEPRDLLSTGAVLRLASDNDGPRSFAPSFWARHGEDIWIATRKPEGAPLAELDFHRLGWVEATDLWRPLAESLAIAHKNGAVHGSITPWTTWWDERAKRLTVVDGGTWIGDAIPRDSTWWAPELTCPTLERHPGPHADVYELARLLLYLVLPPGEAAVADPNFEGVPGYSIPGLRRALSGDPEARQARVSELVTVLSPAPRRTPNPDRVHEGVDVLYGRVHQIEHVGHPQFGEGIKFFLTHPEYDDHGNPAGQETTGTFFYEKRGRDIYASVRHVWEGAELNLLDAERITDSTGTPYLTGRPETLPVLEPHWPVSVTDVLRADGCVSKYFVDLRDSGPSSKALVLGSMLHGMMDDVARAVGDIPTFEKSFDERFPKLRLAMLAAGLADEHYDQFRQECREHFVNIAGYARGRDAEVRDRVGWSGENVEVTRYSSIYGLEGRIDLVTEDRRAGLHIVELKSGSERDEHVSQVRCYRLLWDGVAEKQDMRIHGYLLYSRSGVMRSAPMDDPVRERRILRARNELVAAHKSIAEGDEDFRLPYYLQIPENCHAFCKFRKDRCREQTLLLGLGQNAHPEDATTSPSSPWRGFEPHIVSRAWMYWRHFSRLVELENWDESEGIGRILQSGRLRERIASHQAVANLELADIDIQNGQVTFRGDIPRIFMPGDSVVAHRGDFHGEHILRGTFVESTPSTLKIWTAGAPNAASLAPNGWIVDSLPVRVGHRAAYRGMYAFLNRRDDRLLTVLLDPESPRARELCSPATDTVTVSEESREVLNEQQVKAVHWGLTTHGGCLIQGPPGTGKTTVIAHLVRELLADGQRIVLSAQTNTAVDTMLMALAELGVRDFLRLGHSARSGALCTTLSSLGEDPHEYFSQDVAENTTSLDKLAKRLQYTSVVGCTTHRSVSDDVIQYLSTVSADVPFDVAIVDEATQIGEPLTLGPLRLARRFVLVGDHRQLPAIVTNERATTAAVEGYAWFEPDEEELALTPTARASQLGLFDAGAAPRPERVRTPLSLGGLDRSLFERLVDQGLPHVMLEEQYRMNAEVQAFSSRAYYEERLVPHPAVAGARLDLEPSTLASLPAHVRAVLDPDAPVLFCNVVGEDLHRTNEPEARAVVETVAALISCGAGNDRKSIGVVTPFRAQGQLLRRMLAERLGEAAALIDVDTVERYQGSERDTIIVSLVKTDHAGEFLSDHRRLNVTLTRARRKLILFGHRECLMLSPLFRSLLTQSETHNVDWSAP